MLPSSPSQKSSLLLTPLPLLPLQEVYQTLSQVKGEVEEVIATGRKMVKEGQCTDPDTLTTRLDQLKALYNQVLTLASLFCMQRVIALVQFMWCYVFGKRVILYLFTVYSVDGNYLV